MGLEPLPANHLPVQRSLCSKKAPNALSPLLPSLYLTTLLSSSTCATHWVKTSLLEKTACTEYYVKVEDVISKFVANSNPYAQHYQILQS